MRPQIWMILFECSMQGKIEIYGNTWDIACMQTLYSQKLGNLKARFVRYWNFIPITWTLKAIEKQPSSNENFWRYHEEKNLPMLEKNCGITPQHFGFVSQKYISTYMQNNAIDKEKFLQYKISVSDAQYWYSLFLPQKKTLYSKFPFL